MHNPPNQTPLTMTIDDFTQTRDEPTRMRWPVDEDTTRRRRDEVQTGCRCAAAVVEEGAAKADVICPYCNQTAPLVTGREVYPHRADLYGKRFYQYPPRNAYVGCHDGTDKPLGRLADAELRIAKMRAHDAFDPRWRTKDRKNRPIARIQAYNWLATRLGVSREECHIGMFDVEQCRRVVEICRLDSDRVLRHQTETGEVDDDKEPT